MKSILTFITVIWFVLAVVFMIRFVIITGVTDETRITNIFLFSICNLLVVICLILFGAYL